MKKYDYRLNIISAIKDEIIDRATATRLELIRKREKKKNKIIPIVALAAALAILLSLAMMILVPMLTPGDPPGPGPIPGTDTGTGTDPIPGTDPQPSQIPIYIGMTASSSNGSIESAKAGSIINLSAVIPLDNKNYEGNNGNHGDNNPNKRPIEDIVEEEITTVPPETTVTPDGTIEVIPEEELYYAKPGEDIFITIHFDNPDEYKIMSFKLNGKAYADYMFEYGSDYENIIIKVNVGDTEGLVDYTIDAIQYADREELKYVEMKGDPTLTIGVATENQPAAEITDEIVDINEMSFKVKVTDELELIKLTEGKLYAVITDGEALVDSKEINVSELTEIKFENLRTSTYYEYAIVALYDALDGEGYKHHVIYSKEITTREVVSFANVSADKTSIDFSLLFNENVKTKEINAIELYVGDQKERDIDVTATRFEGLFSNREYTIVVTYINNGETESISYTVKTLAMTAPTVELTQKGNSTKTSFEFDLTYTDPDSIGEITKLELVHWGEAAEAPLDTRSFEDLLSNNLYTVRVTFKYDLNDARSVRTETVELQVRTNGKFKPNVGLESYISDFHSVSFSVKELSDPDNIGEIKKAELYNPDGTLNRELELNTNIVLNDLVLMDRYKVVITFECDYNDGRGIVEETTEITVSTATSQGLEITNGRITGMGTCTDTVLYINDAVNYDAFSENIDITKVIFGNDVSFIDTGSFKNCINLSEVVLGKNIKILHSDVFYGCESLSGTIDLSNVEEIYGMAFWGCKNLEGVIFSDGLKTIGNYAFYNCESLCGGVDLSRLKTIYRGAFSGCTGLSGVIDLSAAETIEAYAFDNCKNIEGVVFGSGLESIGSYAFNNCTSLSGVINLSQLKEIKEYAFYNCKSLSGTIDLSGAEKIGNAAFRECKKLTGVKFGANLATIPSEAFSKCEKLSGVIDLSSVKTIDSNAFSYCVDISGVVFGNQLEHIGSFAFFGCENLSGTINLSSVEIIQSGAFGNCAKLSGSIDLSGVNALGFSAFMGCSNISGTVDLSNLKIIESSAFSDCSNIEKIILNNRLEVIEDYAFSGCKKLSGNIDLSSVETIAEHAFFGCENLEGITFGSNLETIGYYAFGDCKKLSGNIDLSSVETIGVAAFKNCGNIQGVTFGSVLEEIGSSAFSGCSNLTVSGLSNAKKICSEAFRDCAKLAGTIDLSGAELIEYNAFTNCNNISGAIFGAALHTIEYDAFGALTNVYYMGSEDQWKNSVTRGFNWNALGPGDYTMHYNYTPS